ncbi:MAG: hypothetical protein AAFO69_11205 [Bacteroidota bacterium]
MKARLIWTIAIFTTMLLSHGVYSQDLLDSTEIAKSRNIIKLQPFQFIDNTFFLGYEAFNQDYTKSFNIGMGFITSNTQSTEEVGFKYEVQYRIYVNGFKKYVPKRAEAPYNRGIYASVYIAGVRSEQTSEFNYYNPIQEFFEFRENTRIISAFNPGVTIGVQRSVWDNLYVDFYIGGGVRFANVTDSDELFPQSDFEIDDVYDREYTGVFPKIGMSIGLGF